MEIKTKFSLGDEVFVATSPSVTKGTVSAISVEIKKKKTVIRLDVAVPGHLPFTVSAINQDHAFRRKHDAERCLVRRLEGRLCGKYSW